MDTVEVAAFEPVASQEPGVYDFVVRVPTGNVRGDKPLVPGVTTYKQFPYRERARCNESWCQGHVFVFDQGGAAGWHEFYFTRYRTAQQVRTPVAALSFLTTRPHRWDDVILRMGFIEDSTTPLTVQVGGETQELPRLFGRFWMLPGGVYASFQRVEVFVSPRPFDRSMFQLKVPVPTPVRWDLRNERGSLTCLHPEIRFQELQTGGRVLPYAGTVGKPISLTGLQIFPATNYITWTQHVCDEDVTQVRGVWRLVRTTVEPPGVKRIRNAA